MPTLPKDAYKKYYEVLKMRLQDNMTLEEVGRKRGVGRERIRQIEAKAYEILSD